MEYFIAILFGILLGSVITFGIVMYMTYKGLKEGNKDERKVSNTDGFGTPANDRSNF